MKYSLKTFNYGLLIPAYYFWMTAIVLMMPCLQVSAQTTESNDTVPPQIDSETQESIVDDAGASAEAAPQFWYKKGEEHLREGNAEEALKCFNKVLALDPNHLQAWYSRTLALEEQKEKYKELIEAVATVSIPEEKTFKYEISAFYKSVPDPTYASWFFAGGVAIPYAQIGGEHTMYYGES